MQYQKGDQVSQAGLLKHAAVTGAKAVELLKQEPVDLLHLHNYVDEMVNQCLEATKYGIAAKEAQRLENGCIQVKKRTEEYIKNANNQEMQFVYMSDLVEAITEWLHALMAVQHCLR